MKTLRWALIDLALLGLLAGAVDIAVIAGSDHLKEDRAFALVVVPLVGWSFIGTGLFAWWRRPSNVVGALMAAVGFAWFVSQLAASDVPGLFVAGGALGSLFAVLLIHLLLVFPTGRLETGFERFLVWFAYFVGVGLQLLWLPTLDTTALDDCEGCPANPLLIDGLEPVGDWVSVIQTVLALPGIAGVLIALAWRLRRMSEPARATATPIMVAGVVTLLLLVISIQADLTGVPDGAAEDVVDIASCFTLAAIPFAFLFGLLRSRLSRAGAVGDLVSRLGEAGGERQQLCDALPLALGDPSLVVAYYLPESDRFVDSEGHAVELPEDGSRTTTWVERDGRCVAAIVHDAALDEEPELMNAVAAAAALQLENERLDAELRARLEELSESRARIVEASDAERRRLERDLHDGAQQRLVSLALNLRLARARLNTDPAAAAELLDESIAELAETTRELRELARGIHPAVLADRGLGAALAGLTGRGPVPVELVEAPDERLPAPLEAAAYFVVAEALTNVARYADASQASVSVRRENGALEVEVRDDGKGGADPARGSGLRGLADRVAALDGTLDVHSPRGKGTTVRASIPCE